MLHVLSSHVFLGSYRLLTYSPLRFAASYASGGGGSSGSLGPKAVRGGGSLGCHLMTRLGRSHGLIHGRLGCLLLTALVNTVPLKTGLVVRMNG